MATVSGSLLYDNNRTNAATGTGISGIAGVPIVLENTGTGQRLAVLTEANGSYTFINVPNGSYQIVEAYGDLGPFSTTGDFTVATQGPAAIATTPPISFISNPPTGATNLDCLTRNTLPFTISGGTDVTGQRISNGPVRYSPVTIDSSVDVDWANNLISEASSGTFGTFPAGTAGMTGANPNPYPNVNPGFIYDLPAAGAAIPSDGYFTIQNIANDISYQVNGSWWRIADHTTGNETGRMMIVNGANDGESFFEDVVSVTPNTYYLFVTRALNLIKVTGRVDPQLGVLIKASSDGTVLYNKNLGDAIPVNLNTPEWLSDGVLINSGNYSSLDVQFVSLGAAASGNDYAIDDVGFFPVEITLAEPIKPASPTTASTGDTIDFTISFTNNTDTTMTGVTFKDPIPDGLVFVPESVLINGIACVDCDPNAGFGLPNIDAGGDIYVTFKVVVDHVPADGIATNTAFVTYSTTLVGGTPSNTFTTPSNDVDIVLETKADIYVEKVGPATALGRDLITYSISIGNHGPDDAEDVTLSDTIPAQLSSPKYSMDNGLIWEDWTNTLLLGNLESGSTVNILIRGNAINPATYVKLTNIANVTSTTPDPDVTNNTSEFSTILIPKNELSDVFVKMTGLPSTIQAGDVLTYSLVYGNNGPDPAEDTVLRGITNGLTKIMYSTDDGATWQKWVGSLWLGTLQPNQTGVILIKGMVNAMGDDPLINTAIIASITPDSDLSNNKSTVITPYMSGVREDALNQIISSIAMEELALSHIFNAEGEKIQYAIGTLLGMNEPATVKEVLEINASVTKMLESALNFQILLKRKLRDALDAYYD
ncbi:MAG: hypothetical protein FWD97_05515 [Defluviitaleaceae bacterium]|nr:hypothetical protein [Defluviitaleaceae bacterium]